MSEEINSEKSKLSKLQISLLIILYILIISSVVMSIAATRNIGQKGYDRCIKELCEIKPHFCSNFRENNNCCLGAGGKIGMINNEYTCIFD